MFQAPRKGAEPNPESTGRSQMYEFEAIDPSTASGKTKGAFDKSIAQFGGAINLFRTTAHAPNVLHGLLDLHAHVNDSIELSEPLVEQVAMLTSALNRCDYCVNVHMAVGMNAGLSRNELLAAIDGKASEPHAQALLDFADEVVRNRGQVTPATVQAALDAGHSRKALIEAIGIVGLYTTLQYIRHLTDPAHDFPIVREFSAEAHGASTAPPSR